MTKAQLKQVFGEWLGGREPQTDEGAFQARVLLGGSRGNSRRKQRISEPAVYDLEYYHLRR